MENFEYIQFQRTRPTNNTLDNDEEEGFDIPESLSYEAQQKTLAKNERDRSIRLRWRQRKLKRLIKSGDLHAVLTARQMDVLLFSLDGTPISEIAKLLHIDRKTVTQHLEAAINKIKFISG